MRVTVYAWFAKMSAFIQIATYFQDTSRCKMNGKYTRIWFGAFHTTRSLLEDVASRNDLPAVIIEPYPGQILKLARRKAI